MFENLDKQARGVAQMAFSRFDLKDIKEIITNHDLNSDVHQRISKEIAEISKENPNIAQVVIVDIGVNNENESMALAIHKNYMDIGIRPATWLNSILLSLNCTKKLHNRGNEKFRYLFQI